MKNLLFRFTPRAIAAALSASALSSYAASITWDTGLAGTPASGSANWDTTATNWTVDGGTTKAAWVNGNDALFTGANYTVTVGTGLSATSIQSNTTSTVVFNGNTLDVATISTAVGAIDMFTKITGAHGLTYSSSGGGRLNIKAANDYTGDTFLTGSAFLFSDNISNALPTGTTLNLDTGTTFRMSKVGLSQQLAGLVSTTTSAGTISNAVATYTLTLSTKASTTTTFSGTISSTSTTNLLGLVINGSGTQVLNGTNSFYGTTSVSGGTLTLGSNLTNNSSVTVNGGVLNSNVANVILGVGAVSMSSGEISARGAAAAGTFTLAANQAFSTTGGKLTFNIGTGLDQIKGSGTGTFSIGSGTEIALITGTGFSYANTYSLLNGFASGSVSGTGVTITGYDTTNYIASLSNAGVLSFTASAVPEPSTYALFGGVSALGFVVVRRRLRR